MASTEEGRLVEAARDGDQRAFGQLFDQWFDRVHDVARRIVHDPGIASEVAQDSFLKAWTKLATLDDPDAFGGWLLRIARNGALNRLEKERRAVATDDEVLTAHRDRTDAGGDPFDQLDDAGRVALVWEAAAALGERDRSLLDLHLRQGLAPKDLAEELGCTPNNAHQLMFTLRKRLGGAIRAIVLWRAGRPTCPALRVVLEDAGITRFDASTVKAIDAHVDRCEDCAAQRTERVAPAALFAAAPIVAAPLALRRAAAAGLQEAGVPMEGSSAVGAQQPGGDGDGDGHGDGGGDADAPRDLGGATEVSGVLGGSLGGGEPSPDGEPSERALTRRRALLAAGAVALLLAALALWPQGGDDDQEVVAGATTSRPVATTSAAAPTASSTEPTTIRTMVAVPHDDPAPTTATAGEEAAGTPGDGDTGTDGGGGTGGLAGAGEAGPTAGGTAAGGGGATETTAAAAPDTTAPPPPSIDSFTATAVGYCDSLPGWAAWRLDWSTSNASVVTTQKLGQSPVERAVDGTVTHCTKGDTSFTLRASNQEGGAGGAAQTIDAPWPYPVL